jgi:prevent-host-death family protein
MGKPILHLRDLLRAAEAGADVTIIRRGKPVARLTPAG